MKIVRPVQPTADTQPQLHPVLLRLSAMISWYFAWAALSLFCSLQSILSISSRDGAAKTRCGPEQETVSL